MSCVFYRIAIAESGSAFDIGSDTALDKAVWATLNVGLALHEAALLTWQVKEKYMSARPITGIQCRLGARGQAERRWQGPYMGVGTASLSSWQPYQQLDVITPPFSAYVSGHATFSAASAEVGVLTGAQSPS